MRIYDLAVNLGVAVFLDRDRIVFPVVRHKVCAIFRTPVFLDIRAPIKEEYADLAVFQRGLHLNEYGGLELTAEAARFYTSGRARFTPPGGHILQ
jgi:hypothetical protein